MKSKKEIKKEYRIKVQNILIELKKRFTYDEISEKINIDRNILSGIVNKWEFFYISVDKLKIIEKSLNLYF